MITSLDFFKLMAQFLMYFARCTQMKNSFQCLLTESQLL